MTRTDDPTEHFELARRALIERMKRLGTLRSTAVTEAFERTPRQAFVPEVHRYAAYDDRALPLAEGQTISQPSMVAIMLEALECDRSHRVLEVGGGSGYAAALLAHLAKEVHTVELLPVLAESARTTLEEIGAHNVTVHVGDGSVGLPELAPFDRILVSAGARHIPSALVDQLIDGGRMVVPVGGPEGQTLEIGVRRGDHMEWTESIPCMFVPLIEP